VPRGLSRRNCVAGRTVRDKRRMRGDQFGGFGTD
jgi:hypothetical protein